MCIRRSIPTRPARKKSLPISLQHDLVPESNGNGCDKRYSPTSSGWCFISADIAINAVYLQPRFPICLICKIILSAT